MRTVYLNHAQGCYPKAPGVGVAMAQWIDTFDPEGEKAAALAGETEALLRTLAGAPDGYEVRLTPGRGRIPGHLDGAIARLACDHGETPPLEALRRALTAEVKCVMLPQACPACGALFPLGEIGRLCHAHGALLLVDGGDTLGSLPIDLEEMQVDGLLFLGDRSLLGPPGIGGFIAGPALLRRLSRAHGGGGGPHGRPDRPRHRQPRNLPALCGLHAALRWRAGQDTAALREREIRLTGHLLARMSELTYDGLCVPGPTAGEERAATVSIAFPKTEQAEAAARLAARGIYTALLPADPARPDTGALIRMTPGPFLSFEDMDYVQGEVMGVLYGWG